MDRRVTITVGLTFLREIQEPLQTPVYRKTVKIKMNNNNARRYIIRIIIITLCGHVVVVECILQKKTSRVSDFLNATYAWDHVYNIGL